MNRAERRAERRRAKRNRHCAAECPVCGVHAGTWPAVMVAVRAADGGDLRDVEWTGGPIDVIARTRCEIDNVEWEHSVVIEPDVGATE